MLRGKGKKNIQQANTKERGGPQWEANTIKELQKKKHSSLEMHSGTKEATQNNRV